MSVRKLAIPVLLAASLLGGCASNVKLSPEQKVAIDSISIDSKQLSTPLSVEYQIQDSTAFVAGPTLPALLAGAVVAQAMDGPENTNSKMDAVIKLRAFNQLIGPFNSVKELNLDLNNSLKNLGYQVDPQAKTTLKYNMTSCLSENTKTLQVQTNYKLLTRSKKTLHNGKVRVQYSVADTWNKRKLQAVRRSAVQESANLIALDLTDRFNRGKRVSTQYVNGKRGYRQEMIPVESPHHNQNYTLLMGNTGNLISVATETDTLFIRSFFGPSGNCHQNL